MLLYLFLIYIFAYYLFKEKVWNGFTRVVSTLNALQCVYMVGRNLLNRKMFDLYYLPDESSNNALFLFSSYLFVDGIFLLPELTNFNFQLFLSLLHHFIGSFGIYLIAYNEMGFFLGFYFAMTELSTPLLNLSWGFRKPIFLTIFYILFTICRILTIPVLLFYLHINTTSIYTLPPLHSFMCFYGSYTLITLNLIWFIFLTRKISKK
jgi:hypothetical protein